MTSSTKVWNLKRAFRGTAGWKVTRLILYFDTPAGCFRTPCDLLSFALQDICTAFPHKCNMKYLEISRLFLKIMLLYTLIRYFM